MANEKPTTGPRVVPFDLAIERRLILRHEIEIWRDGDREDLQTPDKLKDPERTWRRVASYERLMEALKRGTIELPDDEARAALQQAADGFDDAEEWEETNAIHGAQRALLAVFETTADSTEEPEVPWTTRDDDLAMEWAVLQRVLDVHPARVTVAELLRELVGEDADFGERDAVERAVRDLDRVGLVHTREEFVTPTRAALRFQELSEGAD
jgi:hypothetical protein